MADDNLYSIVGYRWINGARTKTAFTASKQVDGWYYFNDSEFFRYHPDYEKLNIWYPTKNIWLGSKNVDVIGIKKLSVTGYDDFRTTQGKNYDPEDFPTASIEAVEEACDWAEEVALSRYIVYGRYFAGNDFADDLDMYDCSSFVLAAFKHAGFNIGGATFTGNMEPELTQYGFTSLPRSSFTSNDQLERGDILLNYQKHTCLYAGVNEKTGLHTTIDSGGAYNGSTSACNIQTMTGFLTSFGIEYDCVLRYTGV